jgi:tetratricopeptide (TPR) repeat protein
VKRALVTLALVLTAAPAAAQAPDPQVEAERLYDEGNIHFEVAEWDEAIASWRAGYKLVQEPLFLYNIAQAYRQKNDCVNARASYKSYLRKAPTGEYSEKSKKRVIEMEECIRQKGGDPDVEVPDPTVEDPKVEDPKVEDPKIEDPRVEDPKVEVAQIELPERPIVEERHAGTVDRGRTKRIIGLAGGITGVVLAATGGYFSAQARAADRDVEAACEDTCTAEEVDQFTAEGEAAQRNAAILYVAGGVTLAAGIGVYVWGVLDREAPAVTLAPTSGGASVLAGWRF